MEENPVQHQGCTYTSIQEHNLQIEPFVVLREGEMCSWSICNVSHSFEEDISAYNVGQSTILRIFEKSATRKPVKCD